MTENSELFSENEKTRSFFDYLLGQIYNTRTKRREKTLKNHRWKADEIVLKKVVVCESVLAYAVAIWLRTSFD